MCASWRIGCVGHTAGFNTCRRAAFSLACVLWLPLASLAFSCLKLIFVPLDPGGEPSLSLESEPKSAAGSATELAKAQDAVTAAG